MVQESQSIAFEEIPPILKLHVGGKNVSEAEGEVAWKSSFPQELVIPLAVSNARKENKKKPAKAGFVSLVVSVDQDHLCVVLHRLVLKEPTRVQLNFKLGPNQEVSTPGFRDELNFATVSQDPVCVDSIIIEVWTFPRADLLGFCKVPVPAAETALRSEILAWESGEVVGVLELTLRRGSKANLQPFLQANANIPAFQANTPAKMEDGKPRILSSESTVDRVKDRTVAGEARNLKSEPRNAAIEPRNAAIESTPDPIKPRNVSIEQTDDRQLAPQISPEPKEWSHAGTSGLAKLLLANFSDIRHPLLVNELIEVFLTLCPGLTRNEADVIVGRNLYAKYCT